MNKTKRQTRRMLFVLIMMTLMLSGLSSTGAGAANLIAKAKKTAVSEGTWKKTSSGYRYKKENGKYIKNKWVTIDGKVYRFNKNGYLKTGWFVEKGTQYYASRKKGVIYSGSVKVKGVTYYFNKKGAVTSKVYSGKPVYLFVGDSRTVGMDSAVSSANSHFIGKVNAGYYWLKSTAAGQIDSFVKSHKNVIIIFNFGVNDLDHIGSYISWYRQFSYKWPRVSTYFMSVNLVRDGASNASNAGITAFNGRLKKAFGNWYIDSYSYLQTGGFSSVDGLHYLADTYRKIHTYVISQIQTKMKA